jgi:hypothetical protein
MTYEPDEIEPFIRLGKAKSRRQRRRELESQREPGHLKAWFERQDWRFQLETRSVPLFKQVIRSMRHSCHSWCCRIDQYEKRHRHKLLRREKHPDLPSEL